MIITEIKKYQKNELVKKYYIIWIPYIVSLYKINVYYSPPLLDVEATGQAPFLLLLIPHQMIQYH